MPLASKSNSQSAYDEEIKSAVGIYWSGLTDWRWLWAQLKQESRFNPKAVSPVGAAGVAQFMPGTWKEVVKAMNYPQGVTPFQTEYAIRAAAYYMRKQRNSWAGRERPELDRWDLARASYNAGIGHLLKAQKLCDNANLYKDIIVCLPRVTGRHSTETINYNIYIHKFYKERLIWGQ